MGGRRRRLVLEWAVLLGGLAMAGCATDHNPANRTPAGVIVDNTSGEDVSFEQIDNDYYAVKECWGMPKDDKLFVVVSIEPPISTKSGAQVIACDKEMSPSGLCYGWRFGPWVHVPPDLKALKHELSHMICDYQMDCAQVCRDPQYGGGGRCWL